MATISGHHLRSRHVMMTTDASPPAAGGHRRLRFGGRGDCLYAGERNVDFSRFHTTRFLCAGMMMGRLLRRCRGRADEIGRFIALLRGYRKGAAKWPSRRSISARQYGGLHRGQCRYNFSPCRVLIYIQEGKMLMIGHFLECVWLLDTICWA